jgi:hypothetical protein
VASVYEHRRVEGLRADEEGEGRIIRDVDVMIIVPQFTCGGACRGGAWRRYCERRVHATFPTRAGHELAFM